jgi:uncharacterized GH25 family protein
MRPAYSLLLCATAALAHFAWIAPVPPVLTVGAVAGIQMGIGHELGNPEAAPPLVESRAYALAPSGAKTDLKPALKGLALMADYTVKEAGQHRFVFLQDRGIRSRTPKGIKVGGRDQHPDATQSFHTLRTAVAYAATAGTKFDAKAVGLSYELVPQRSADSITVTLLANGKPCAGGEVAVSWAGKKEVVLGKTGADGKMKYAIPAGAKGPLVIVAEQPFPAPKTAKYDTDNFETAVYLNW